MRNRCIIQIEALWRLCLEAYAIAMQAKQLRDAGADDGSVRTDLGSRQNQAGIDISNAVTGVAHAFQGFAQKDDGIRALPFRIGRRKENADVWRGNRSEQRIRDGVEKNVAIRVPAESFVMRQRDAADLQGNLWPELVRVEAVADADRRFRVSSFRFRVSSFRFQVV